jgi:flavin reductase (DIM6/NTAB) family NADH-FMN oxidoreductase RutF
MKVNVKKLEENFFRTIADEWMLITAGSREGFNTMTASWGTIGELWNRSVAICFVRPQRHTFRFMEANDYYTLCFFSRKHRDILKYCGAHSGSKVDKVKETGLKPLFTELGNVYFEQARLVLECRKLYADHIKPGMFIVKEMDVRNYPSRDYHKFYIGQVINCLQF